MKKSERLMKKIITTCNSGAIKIVAKASKRCNIRPPCEYCYDYIAQSEDKTLDMSEETAENLIKITVGDNAFRHVTFIWHGGEPLIVGRAFYEKVLDFQRKYNTRGIKIVNRIQTNAVAMDKDWVEFLKENNFYMETSFDAFDNDKTRGRTGRVLENIVQARDMGYIPGNIMFICTKRNVHRLREAYDYFEKLELNFNPSPIISLGKACQAQYLAITPEEYGNALADLLDYYVVEHEKRKTRVRILDAVLSAVMTGQQNLCSHGFCVYEFIAVDHLGDVYPCAKVTDPAWIFGNVNVLAKFSQVFNSPHYSDYVKECSQRVRQCATENEGKPCNILEYCKGGCSSNALSAGGYSKRDFYCQTYKIIFNHAINLIEKIQDDKFRRTERSEV
jgi:uncharacterized protein